MARSRRNVVRPVSRNRYVYFTQFGMVSGQTMWVEVECETGIVVGQMSWLPRMVGTTLEDAAFEVMRFVDDWVATLNPENR